jgi:hypothetical protein
MCVGRTWSLGLRGHLDDARGARGAGRVEADGVLAGGYGGTEGEAGEHFEVGWSICVCVYVSRVRSGM